MLPRPQGTRCDQFLARAGEEPLGVDRFFATPVDAAYDLRLTALPRPGGTLPLARPVTASASTVLTGDVTVGAHAAVDGDPATAWLAEPTDDAPTLRLAWVREAHPRPDPAGRAGGAVGRAAGPGAAAHAGRGGRRRRRRGRLGAVPGG